MLSRLLAPFLLLLACAGLAFAQGRASTGAIAGLVRDLDNRPLANAVVRATGGPTARTVRSNGDGSYRLGEMGPGTYELNVQKPGYAAQTRRNVGVVANGTTKADFKLEWTNAGSGGLEAIVLDRSGTALPDTIVTLFSQGQSVAQGSTDDAGFYVFTGLRPGGYRFTARRPGFAENGSGTIQVLAGRLSRLIVTLTRDGNQSGRIVGTVRNTDGQAINRARVAITAGLSRADTRTGIDGRFELGGLVPGAGYSVQATAEGYASQTLGNLRVEQLQDTVATFVLVPNAPTKGSITGVIRDQDARTLPFTTVQLTAGPSSGQTVQADADGRYTFTELSPGVYAVTATLSGYNPAGAAGIEVGAGRTAVANLVLRQIATPPGIIQGVVRQQGAGTPIQNVRVEITEGPSRGLTDLTDGAGAFKFEGLIPGENYALRFTRESYENAVRTRLVVRSGGTVNLEVALAVRSGALGKITGTVSRLGGNAQAGVKVTLFAGASSPLTTTTESDGSFAFANLKAGTGYGVRAEKAGYKPAEERNLTVTGNQETHVNLVLRPGETTGSIEGTLVNLLLQPVVNARVRVLSGPSTPPEVRSNSQGRFLMEALSPGTYTIEASANGYRTTQRSGIAVTAGSTTRFTLQMLQ